MTSLKEIIYALLDEVKAILKEYVHEKESALKKRIQKLLIAGIAVTILVSLVISFIGSAALFILIGSLKYLSTFLPVWEAWIIMGVNSAVIAIVLLVVVFIIIRRQLKSR